MNKKHTILVVEDEEQLQRMLQSTLIQAGYDVLIARSGAAAQEQLEQHSVSVMLLDLGLPDIDGKEVISRSRAVSKAPIVVISARGSEKEKIAALDIGANDYMAKPFDTGELLARIRVALRPAPQCDGHGGTSKRLVIDFDRRQAVVDGHRVRLSRKEAELARILAKADGEVVSREKLVEEIWGGDGETESINLRVLAWQVRRKIEPDPAAPQYLISESGEGYRLIID